MGEHGNIGMRDDHKYIVVDCSNGMSYIGDSVFGGGQRKGEDAGVKIKNYVIARTDALLSEVLGEGKSFEQAAKGYYKQRIATANPGTFSPGSLFVGVHNLDEHL